LVAANDVECQQLVSEYGARHERITAIPCGVDTDLFRPGDARAARAALGLDERPLLLYVGRSSPMKGLETLLHAVARLAAPADGGRLLVGGGEGAEPVDGHESTLRRRVAALGLGDAVRFLGPQPQPSLRDFYVAADALVLPSYYESFGMVALEAMACGTPVVA